jgi:hypothetical protein
VEEYLATIPEQPPVVRPPSPAPLPLQVTFGDNDPQFATPHGIFTFDIHIIDLGEMMNGMIEAGNNLADQVIGAIGGRMENSHDPGVIDSVKDLTNKLLAKYDPNAEHRPIFEEHLKLVRPDLSERTKAMLDDESKMNQTISSYNYLTPTQALNLIYGQAVEHYIGKSGTYEEREEMLKNVTENLALVLVDALTDQSCPTGIYNRIMSSSELYNLDGHNIIISSDEYIKTNILSRMAIHRDAVLKEETDAGDPTGVVKFMNDVTVDETPQIVRRRAELTAKIAAICDKEFNGYRYYKKNRDMLVSTIF